jgi:hypothetical protein
MAVYISPRQGCRVKRAIGRIALIMQVRGVWVYEIADLTNIRKTEVEQIDAGAAIGRLASAPSEEGICGPHHRWSGQRTIRVGGRALSILQ